MTHDNPDVASSSDSAAVSSTSANGNATPANPDDRAAESNGAMGNVGLPELSILPPRIPLQLWRASQSNIPDERALRDRIKLEAKKLCEERAVVPPLSMVELREFAREVVARCETDEVFVDFAAILVSNEAWRETLAQVPYDRRLLLLPKCLRLEEHCPAPFDEFGLLCKECGLCSIEDLTKEADRLGYAVLVAEGSAIVRSMIDTGKIEAIVGVSCLNVLEKSFPHMEAAAIPGIAIPLLQDDCVNTNVDMDHVWDVIHLTADDKTYRLDLDALKEKVEGWFTLEGLEHSMGPASGKTDEIAREWLARAGKRWRPYLTACVKMAHEYQDAADHPPVTDDLRKLCIAVECFHKASLVHDDIEDGDDERYGESTLHAEHGIAVALNVGDLLLGEGYRLISELEVDGETRTRMLSCAARGHVTLARGQGAELTWANDPRPLSSLDVLQIFREKTAPAFEVALQLGAYYAGADETELAALADYSESLGVAYQIRDDLDDMTGESDSDDLADLRPSLILAIALKRAREGEEQAMVESLWRRERPFAEVADGFATLLEERGVARKACELRDAYEQNAVNALRVLENATLKGLLRRVIGKIFGDKLVLEGYCGEFEAKNLPAQQPGQEAAAPAPSVSPAPTRG